METGPRLRIHAVVEGGVLVPKEPLGIKDGEEVIIDIHFEENELAQHLKEATPPVRRPSDRVENRRKDE